MKDFLGKQVTEEEHGMGIAYLLENNELFYDIGYKVMQNLEETYLLKCHRLKYNGKIKLVYLSFFRIYINSHSRNGTCKCNAGSEGTYDSTDSGCVYTDY